MLGGRELPKPRRPLLPWFPQQIQILHLSRDLIGQLRKSVEEDGLRDKDSLAAPLLARRCGACLVHAEIHGEDRVQQLKYD